MTKKLTCLICLLGLAFTNILKAQVQVPVGSWQSHYSYLTADAVELVGDKLFSGANHLSVYSLSENEYFTYSKANGLSDVGISHLRYDPSSGYLFIIYKSGNIDIYKDNLFLNLPDIKNLNVTGSKKINDIYFKNNLAYLSTDFGIVVVNPMRKEIKESYILQDNASLIEIKSFCSFNGYFYAATNKGLFRAEENSNTLQNFANWTKVSSQPLEFCVNFKNNLYIADDSTLCQFQTSLDTLFTSKSVFQKIRGGSEKLYTCEADDDYRAIHIFDALGQLQDSIFSVNPRDLVELNNQEIWVADFWNGLLSINNKVINPYHPNGIYTNSTYNLNVLNNELYVSAGGENGWIFTYNGGGISRLQTSGEWTYYNRFIGTPSLDSINDIMEVALDKRNNYLYAASFHDGLWEYHMDDNTAVNYKNTPYIQFFGGYRVAGLTMDENNNLWMSNYGAQEQLVVKKADGSWQKFSLPYSSSEKTASQIVIDNIGQKWVLAPRGVGIFVYNDNGTIDNKNDDQVKLLRSGDKQGNLANNEVNCMAKDKNGKIWIGTIDGIAIMNCPESIFSSEGCDAELKIVKYDLDAGLLFQRENVRTIAVDGANNKWIGTNNGVWLISDDAEKIIKRFNTDNSPLPSNEINKIIVHPVTGDVFIATNAGLVSFRGEATDGNTTNDNLLVFPNPVPSTYSGSIVIKGLVENADVRIADAAGQLVFKTKAQGGQAIWNGKNYLNQKPRTGVYFVFVSNEDGSEAKAGKFIFNE